MGNELPADAADVIKKWSDKSYKFGLGQEWADDKWKVTDRNAINFFKEHDQYFFGKQFQHYAPQMREIVENELKGVARAYDPKVMKSLKEKMGDEFAHPKITDYYDLVVRNAVNKSRNFGRTLSYERLGISELEVVAILDKKTSKICREMNGRRIKTSVAADHVRDVLKTPMDELTEQFAWPNDNDAKKFAEMSTDEIMGKIKVKLPPYHARCRTTTVISMDTKISKSSGGFFKGEVEYDRENEQAVKRADKLKKLSKQELLSKVESLAQTRWWDDSIKEWPDGTTRSSYEYHKSKHGKEFPNGYDNAFKTLLKKYDKVYTFGDNNEWIIYDSDSKSFLHLSETGKVLRFHKYNSFKQKGYMAGIK